MMAALASKHISTYAVGRYDPTRTLTLRNAFARDMRKRFTKLAALIIVAIDNEDVFALKPGSGGYTTHANMTSPGRHAFDFPRTGDKLTSFMNWLKKQEQAGILEITQGQQLGTAVENSWTNKYIQSAYQRGIARARQELIGAGYAVPRLSASGGINVAFNIPLHLDRIGLLYTRTFSELQGITGVMDQQISRVLGQALVEGRNPREMARLLTRTITGPVGDLSLTDTLGRFIPAQRRAEMLARTETIRAHHTATVQEYRNWRIEGVRVKAEWVTAEDGAVCPDCDGLQGQVFSLDDISGMIPFHPNCRCVAIPVDVTDQKEGE